MYCQLYLLWQSEGVSKGASWIDLRLTPQMCCSCYAAVVMTARTAGKNFSLPPPHTIDLIHFTSPKHTLISEIVISNVLFPGFHST